MEIQVDIKRVEKDAVNAILDHVVDEEKLYASVREQVSARIDTMFATKAETIIADEIEAAIKNAFDRVYTPVDAFGKPTSDPTTIRQRMQSLVDDFWSQRVDANGAPVKSDSWSMKEKPTRAEWALMRLCKDDLSTSLKQELVNTAAQLKDGFRKQLRSQVDVWLGEIFHVRSADDKAESRRK